MQIEENFFLDHLKELINKKNIFCFFGLSKKFYLKNFKTFLKSLLVNNFVCISKTNEFKSIDYRALQTIISSSELNVSSEVEVFEAVVSWVGHDETSRRHLTCDLLKLVRLQLLSPGILNKLVKEHKFCRSCQICCDHIENILTLKQRPNKSVSQHRSCMNEFTNFLLRENEMVCLKRDDSFERKYNIFRPLDFINFKYIGERHYTSINLFSNHTSEWVRTFPKLRRLIGSYDELLFFTSCMFMEKLYVTGGLYERCDLESDICLMYDPETNEWKKLQEMHNGRYRHSCVVFAGKIVVTGGCFDSVEAYDHFENKWTHMPNLTEGKRGHGSVALGNKLFVIGGIESQNCEVFDYVSDRFTRIKPFPLKWERFDYDKFEFFRVKNEIVVKYDADENEDNVYVYDPVEDKWSSMHVELFKENSAQLLRC